MRRGGGFGTLGGGAAMSDAELDKLIAEEDPKSSQAQQMSAQQTQQVAVKDLQQQIDTAKKRAFVTGAVVFGGIALAFMHFRDK